MNEMEARQIEIRKKHMEGTRISMPATYNAGRNKAKKLMRAEEKLNGKSAEYYKFYYYLYPAKKPLTLT